MKNANFYLMKFDLLIIPLKNSLNLVKGFTILQFQ
jgi:hypothetical protein